MYIRQVKAKELPELTELINSHVIDPSRIDFPAYVAKLQASGFLVGEVTEKKLNGDLNKVFLVVKEKSRIIGYIRIDNELDDDFIALDKQGGVDWVHNDFKKRYYSKKHFEIGGILVSSEFARKSIGKELLEKALEALEFEDVSELFSFVPIHPVTNDASLRFHLKNGFKIVAKLKPVVLFGMKNYQSDLLMLDLDSR